MKTKSSDKTKKTHISAEKIKTVKELEQLIKNNKTIMVASVKNLPAVKFQEIGKKLRGKAEIRVPKKNLIQIQIYRNSRMLYNIGLRTAKQEK